MPLEAYFNAARQRVQARPSDLGARSSLWQIFAARGEWDRAQTQLDAMVAVDGGWAAEAAACQQLLAGERQRAEVMTGRQAPVCVGEPPPWFADLAAALPQLASEDAGQRLNAVHAMRRVQQAATPCVGKINGGAFNWLCDGDARLGPCLEIIVNGNYFWLPWERLRSISSRTPTEIRDRLWLHALLTMDDETTVEGFLPARYPGPRDDPEHLGEVTHWQAIDDRVDSVYLGRGQKTLLTDQGDWGLLDIRELRLEPQPS